MKTFFVEARYDDEIEVPGEVIEKLPERVGLAFTVQFIGSKDKVKEQIEETGREVILVKGKHTKYEGQMYGCNLEKFEGDEFLYVGDGLFHPKALVLSNNKKVHIWNPVKEEYSVLTRKIMEKELMRQKAAYSKFLMSDKIGVLLTTKPGQSYLDYALKLKEEYPDKKFYYVVMDTIDFPSLEDFKFVEVWVNTACPRIGWDDTKRANKPMVDLNTVLRQDF